ncbi:hypothetical protein [Actinokineospora sp. HUAS TT18]|uniref:hypothetical protein n=1 Tax=Actinokineospora sp. HUAS TT18 TaxID=3447451 RepID=UPI003F51E40B
MCPLARACWRAENLWAAGSVMSWVYGAVSPWDSGTPQRHRQRRRQRRQRNTSSSRKQTSDNRSQIGRQASRRPASVFDELFSALKAKFADEYRVDAEFVAGCNAEIAEAGSQLDYLMNRGPLRPKEDNALLRLQFEGIWHSEILSLNTAIRDAGMHRQAVIDYMNKANGVFRNQVRELGKKYGVELNVF